MNKYDDNFLIAHLKQFCTVICWYQVSTIQEWKARIGGRLTVGLWPALELGVHLFLIAHILSYRTIVFLPS